MGNEPLEANTKGQNVKGRKVNQWRNAKGRKVNRRRNAKGQNAKGRKVNRRRNTKGQISATIWISATKMGLSATKWAYRRRNGLIGDKMGLSVTEWAYQRWNGLIGNGFCFGLGLEPSRTVISVGCRSRREWFNDWVWVWVWTVANGYRRWFGFLLATVWEVIGDSLGVIDDG